MSDGLWFWVTPVDDVDALGDYGGFTFQTHSEAVQFIHDEYRSWFDNQDAGYYDADAAPSLLQIETVRTVKIEVIDAERVSS